MDVDFFVLDLRFIGAPPEVHTAALQNMKNALKEYGYIKACLPSKETLVVAVVAVSSVAEVVLMPQRFNLVAFHKAVDQLNPKNVAGHASFQEGVLALEQATRLIKQVKKKHRDVSNMRVSYFSSTWLPQSDTVNAIMKSLFDDCVALHFYQIIYPVEGTDVDTNDLTNFILLSREWINCAFSRVDYNKFSILCALKTLANVPCIANLRLMFSDKQVLECEILKPLFNFSNIPKVEICPCHNKRLAQPSSLESSCSVTGAHILPEKITSGYQIGSLVIHVGEALKGRKSVDFTVAKRINLATLSEHLLYGEPYLIYSEEKTFLAMCQLLNQKNEGLLVTSNYHLDSGERTLGKQYFLAYPVIVGSMLLKRLATEENLKPLPQRDNLDIPEDKVLQAQEMLTTIEHIDYNPLNFNSELYSQLERVIPSAKQKKSIDPNSNSLQPVEPTKPTQPKKRLLHPMRVNMD